MWWVVHEIPDHGVCRPSGRVGYVSRAGFVHRPFPSPREHSILPPLVSPLGQNRRMRMDDFLKDPTDGWGAAPVLDEALMDALVTGPQPGDDDLATALNLARFVHQEFVKRGTDETQSLTNEESRVALRTLRLVLQRHAVDLDVPWRDFASFRAHWIAEGLSGAGGWSARALLLKKYFGPVLETLERAEEEGLRATLAEPVSPRAKTGWLRVDDEIGQLRLRFRSASTPQDYKDVGNRCVGVLEALSATVYDPQRHCPEGQNEPPVDRTDTRIGAYIEERLPGKQNEELRGLVKKSSALAHNVKHSHRSDRTSAGIAADAVILLANVLRRLAE